MLHERWKWLQVAIIGCKRLFLVCLAWNGCKWLSVTSLNKYILSFCNCDLGWNQDAIGGYYILSMSRLALNFYQWLLVSKMTIMCYIGVNKWGWLQVAISGYNNSVLKWFTWNGYKLLLVTSIDKYELFLCLRSERASIGYSWRLACIFHQIGLPMGTGGYHWPCCAISVSKNENGLSGYYWL